MLQFTTEACSALVGARPPNKNLTPYYVTISPNPSTKVEAILRVPRGKYDKLVEVKKKVRYDCIPQQQQFKYCIEHLKSTYLSLCDNDCYIVGTTELNKSGNVHLHLLLYSKNYKGVNGLHELRRDILCCPTTILNLKRNGKDYMNNIVICEDISKTIEYFDKEYGQNIKDGKYLNYFLSL